MDDLSAETQAYLGWILQGRRGRAPVGVMLGPLHSQRLIDHGYLERSGDETDRQLLPTEKALRYAHLFQPFAAGPRLRPSDLT